MPGMKLWSWQKENLPSIGHSVRTALAATASVIVARLVQMPEAYWAAIATLVVMQSSLGATLTLSIERIVATALGASVGAVETNYFGSNLVAFMLAIFFIGLLSFGFRLEKTAYRYASVTLTIIVLIPRTNPANSQRAVCILCPLSVIKQESFEDAEQESDQRTKQCEPEREVPLGDAVVFGFHRNVSVFLSRVPSLLLTRRAILP